jgi:hypothetical protein
MNEKEKIKQLIAQGYHVEIVNPDGRTFEQKYKVWQSVGWNNLKVAVVNDGKVSGLQG